MSKVKSVEKQLFLSNIGLYFTAREKVLNNFQNRLFPTKNLKPEPESELKIESKLETESNMETEKNWK